MVDIRSLLNLPYRAYRLKAIYLGQRQILQDDIEPQRRTVFAFEGLVRPDRLPAARDRRRMRRRYSALGDKHSQHLDVDTVVVHQQ